MTFADTTSDNDGTEPTAKHADPIMKRTPTHQPMSRGAHRTAWGRPSVRSLGPVTSRSAARTVPLPVPTGGEFDNLAVGAAHQFANDEWPPMSPS